MKENKIQITIYPMTGQQGIFFVPKKWCEECDLVISLVENVINELNVRDKTTIKIRPWFLWAWVPFFRYFAWHPPILVINGKIVSLGIVPKKEHVIQAMMHHDA